MERMQQESDFNPDIFEPAFFSTSQVGENGPALGGESRPLHDAYDIGELSKQDIVVSCQGGSYTKKVYDNLRKSGWNGYWIDAASALRMRDESIIVLDPVNREVIDNGLAHGTRTFVGGNCTVSLMLMALAGLFKAHLVEWVSSMTYQAASGAGAKNMIELVRQMTVLTDSGREIINDPALTALQLDSLITKRLRNADLPMDNFGVPLAASLIPWIDTPMENGQTREEWKGAAEANKILGTQSFIPIDGICVRIGAMRCHSQGFTVKLRKDVPIDEITDCIARANKWVRVIPNTKEATISELTPAAVSGELTIPVGRLRKMNIGPDYLAAFSVGDQLLWGAAEPIRRILNIVLEHVQGG
jgi:aspartate-semialdehyde dehydrogenase